MAETTENRCQTKGCPNTFQIIMLWVGDSTAQYLCIGCWAAACTAIIATLAEQGTLPAAEADAAAEQLPDVADVADAKPAAEQLPEPATAAAEPAAGLVQCERCEQAVDPAGHCVWAGARGCMVQAALVP